MQSNGKRAVVYDNKIINAELEFVCNLGSVQNTYTASEENSKKYLTQVKYKKAFQIGLFDKSTLNTV